MKCFCFTARYERWHCKQNHTRENMERGERDRETGTEIMKGSNSGTSSDSYRISALRDRSLSIANEQKKNEIHIISPKIQQILSSNTLTLLKKIPNSDCFHIFITSIISCMAPFCDMSCLCEIQRKPTGNRFMKHCVFAVLHSLADQTTVWGRPLNWPWHRVERRVLSDSICYLTATIRLDALKRSATQGKSNLE